MVKTCKKLSLADELRARVKENIDKAKRHKKYMLRGDVLAQERNIPDAILAYETSLKWVYNNAAKYYSSIGLWRLHAKNSLHKDLEGRLDNLLKAIEYGEEALLLASSRPGKGDEILEKIFLDDPDKEKKLRTQLMEVYIHAYQARQRVEKRGAYAPLNKRPKGMFGHGKGDELLSKAIEHFEKAYMHEPAGENKEGLNLYYSQIGDLYAERGEEGDFSKAIECYRRLLVVSPPKEREAHDIMNVISWLVWERYRDEDYPDEPVLSNRIDEGNVLLELSDALIGKYNPEWDEEKKEAFTQRKDSYEPIKWRISYPLAKMCHHRGDNLKSVLETFYISLENTARGYMQHKSLYALGDIHLLISESSDFSEEEREDSKGQAYQCFTYASEFLEGKERKDFEVSIKTMKKMDLIAKDNPYSKENEDKYGYKGLDYN